MGERVHAPAVIRLRVYRLGRIRERELITERTRGEDSLDKPGEDLASKVEAGNRPLARYKTTSRDEGETTPRVGRTGHRFDYSIGCM